MRHCISQQLCAHRQGHVAFEQMTPEIGRASGQQDVTSRCSRDHCAIATNKTTKSMVMNLLKLLRLFLFMIFTISLLLTSFTSLLLAAICPKAQCLQLEEEVRQLRLALEAHSLRRN